jgi:hypothetical protein
MIGIFRKIPFACSYPTFKQGTIANFVLFAIGFSACAFGIPSIEVWALPAPWRFAFTIPLLACAWYGVAHYRSGLIDQDRQLTFEENSASAVELLNLSKQ